MQTLLYAFVVVIALAASTFVSGYSFWYTETDPILVSVYLYGVPILIGVAQFTRLSVHSWYVLPVAYTLATAAFGWDTRLNPYTLIILSLIAVWMSVYAFGRSHADWKARVNWFAIYVVNSAFILGMFAYGMDDAFINADVRKFALRAYILGIVAITAVSQFYRPTSMASWLFLPGAYLVALFGLRWDGYFMKDLLFLFCVYALAMLVFRKNLGARLRFRA